MCWADWNPSIWASHGDVLVGVGWGWITFDFRTWNDLDTYPSFFCSSAFLDMKLNKSPFWSSLFGSWSSDVLFPLVDDMDYLLILHNHWTQNSVSIHIIWIQQKMTYSNSFADIAANSPPQTSQLTSSGIFFRGRSVSTRRRLAARPEKWWEMRDFPAMVDCQRMFVCASFGGGKFIYIYYIYIYYIIYLCVYSVSRSFCEYSQGVHKLDFDR